jgi:hypothetical protein
VAGYQDFHAIRSWDGSQDRAFEELCYQLRDQTPKRAQLVKTGDPDGGVEWYVRHANGIEWGWQAKYSFKIDTLLDLMERSLKTVTEKRPKCRRLTFCIPFDLPDAPGGKERKSARQKFEDRKLSWKERIPRAEHVEIQLLSAGDLLDRLAQPANRGREYFFWDQEVFSPEWCRKRLDITLRTVGERYTPTLHVDLPVAFSLEGLARSEEFWRRYQKRRGEVREATERLSRAEYKGLGVTREVKQAVRQAAAWLDATPDAFVAPHRLPRERLVEQTVACVRQVEQAYPDRSTTSVQSKQCKDDRKIDNLRYYLGRLSSALSGFRAFFETPASLAAERAALLMTGSAGQGKTHLLCDVAERAVAAGRPAVVLLGGSFGGRRVWSDIAEQLGLGNVGSDLILDAMRAAAEASQAPFVLLIDALNESGDPAAWQSDLPRLLAEAVSDPWVAIGFSVRSSYSPVVLPPEGLGSVAEVDHPGFSGRELEATERYFDNYGLDQPRVPLLTPEFSNPLFLKLYCEALQGLGLRAAPGGEDHVSAIFERYFTWKSKRVVQRLGLDPVGSDVRKALQAFAVALAERGRDVLPRSEAAQLLNPHAPGCTQWPSTMFGALLNEGMLSADSSYNRETRTYEDVVRFTFQRFADYQIAASLLDGFQDASALKNGLKAGRPLRARIRKAPAGWIEALSVLISERFGVELLDAANWRLDSFARNVWEEALLESIGARKSTAVTQRGVALALEFQTHSHRLSEQLLELLLTVAPIPGHPLNADWLHAVLMRRPMPERDTLWTTRVYHEFGSEGPLMRLLRWLGRATDTACGDEVAQLAAIPAIWTFTSPNRYLRDFATKAVASFLSQRLAVANSLVQLFRGVDDPYVMERLAVAAHGAVLIGGRAQPQHARELAETLRAVALADDQIPNFLTRDAVRGIDEWCQHTGLITIEEYNKLKPPYGSAPPSKPRTKKQLERKFDRTPKQPSTGHYVPSPYGALFSSIFDMGDFGRYVIESKVHRFTQHPLGTPIPKYRPRKPKPDRKAREKLEAELTPEQVALAESDPLEFLESLASIQSWSLSQALVPPTKPDPKAQYSSELAQRWVFERVISLGWTPEQFGDFDRHSVYGGAGREAHKAERVGKKYQWIALRELVARIADNFHMAKDWGDESSTYRGPWQFYGRDIDPTLPPPRLVRDEDDTIVLGSTFDDEQEATWWMPQGPTYTLDDPPAPDDWASDLSEVPTFDSLLTSIDPDGARWITLQGYFNWDEPSREGEDRYEMRRRDMWSHIYGWIVKSEQRTELVKFLESTSLMGRWMPEGPDLTDDAFLGEMPWADAVTSQLSSGWHEIHPRGNTDSPASDLLAHPSWISYMWEGGILDCSLVDSTSATMPSVELSAQSELRWLPGTRSWSDQRGVVVARYESAAGHRALLVRERWLRQVLKRSKWALVCGWLGERSLFSGGLTGGRVRGQWMTLDGTASFDPARGWNIGGLRSKLKNHG